MYDYIHVKKKTTGLFWTHLKHLYISRGNKGCHTTEGWAPADTSEISSAGTFIPSLGSVHCGQLLPSDQALGLQVLFVLVAITEANSLFSKELTPEWQFPNGCNTSNQHGEEFTANTSVANFQGRGAELLWQSPQHRWHCCSSCPSNRYCFFGLCKFQQRAL